jgi:hypothetical protein
MIKKAVSACVALPTAVTALNAVRKPHGRDTDREADREAMPNKAKGKQ